MGSVIGCYQDPELGSYKILLARILFKSCVELLLGDLHYTVIYTDANNVFIGIFILEPSVRVELMEQVPHVAVYCYEHHSMMEAVPQYILFIVLRFLTDSNNQVTGVIINRAFDRVQKNLRNCALFSG